MDTSFVLNLDMLLVLAVLALSVWLFVSEWWPADVSALFILVLIGLMGLVPLQQLFSGFASNAVMSILAVMILGAGLDRTGLMSRAADFILYLAGDTERRLVLAMSAVAGVISGFMQNPAVVALFLPVASQIAARTGYPLAHLLLPMAACIVLGGTMTTVGNSPMILLNDLLDSSNKNLPQGAQTLANMPLFAPFPIGLSLLILGLLYFYFWGLRRLPANESDQAVTPRTTEAYFEKLYGQSGEIFELRVYPDSLIAGTTVLDAENLPGAPWILAIKSASETRLAPPADTPIVAGCVIAVLGQPLAVEQFASAQGMGVLPGNHHLGELFDAQAAGVSEAILPPNSSWVGLSASELRLRKRYGMSLLAISRQSQLIHEQVRGEKLQPGDSLIFHSSWSDLNEHLSERDFVVITDYPKEARRPHKQGLATLFFVGAFLLGLLAHIPLPIALFAGAVGMLVTGVISIEEAYRAINWKTIFSLACLIPLSIAIDQTGTAAWIAGWSANLLGGLGLYPMQIMLALTATLAAMSMSQVGATVLMVPIAINVALAVNGDPKVFALIVTLAASNNFLTNSNPVIAMISGPGNYQAKDLWHVTWPLSLAFVVVSVVLVNLIY